MSDCKFHLSIDGWVITCEALNKHSAIIKFTQGKKEVFNLLKLKDKSLIPSAPVNLSTDQIDLFLRLADGSNKYPRSISKNMYPLGGMHDSVITKVICNDKVYLYVDVGAIDTEWGWTSKSIKAYFLPANYAVYLMHFDFAGEDLQVEKLPDVL